MDKNQKKAKKTARRAAKEAKRKKEFELEKEARVRVARDYFVHFGVWDALKKTTARDYLDRCYYPEPEIVMSDDLPDQELASTLKTRLTAIVRKASFDSPILGPKFSVARYFSAVKPVVDYLRAMKVNDAKIRSIVEDAIVRLGDLGAPEMELESLSPLRWQLEEELAKFGRMDSGLYYCRFDYGRDSHRRAYIRFVVEYCAPEVRTVSKDGKPRPAYRCGQPHSFKIDWVVLDSQLISPNAAAEKLQVYIQQHALIQLRTRLGVFQNDLWVVDEWLWQSLKKPVVVDMQRNDGKVLIEYRLYQHKLGYLLAQIVDGVVLIETFLFLTMDGTPEGQRLWKHLKLQRDDKKFLSIDTLAFFLLTDVQHDKELVRILGECDCGHLFAMLKKPLTDVAKGYASDVRKHLRLDSK